MASTFLLGRKVDQQMPMGEIQVVIMLEAEMVIVLEMVVILAQGKVEVMHMSDKVQQLEGVVMLL